MSFAELFYQIRRQSDRLNNSNMVIVAYAGSAAYHEIMRDNDMYSALVMMGLEQREVPEFCGIKIVHDKSAPEPELIKIFVDGVHLFTANSETEQVTQIEPSEDAETVWQLAAVGRFFGDHSHVHVSSPVLQVREPISPNIGKDFDPQAQPSVKHWSVHLGDLVNTGILRRDGQHYTMTHQGRIACNAAMHFDALYHAQSRKQWKAINRALMEM